MGNIKYIPAINPNVMDSALVRSCSTLWRASQSAEFVKQVVIGRLGLAKKRDKLLIACAPKSGSTYLVRLLMNLTGNPRLIGSQFLGSNEQDLDAVKMYQLRHDDGIFHHHLKATENNIDLVKKYDLKVVVITRNIFDSLVSLKDHIRRESDRMPTGYIPPYYNRMNEEDQYRLLAAGHTSWYLNFVLSWHTYAKERPDVLWLTYERLFEDPVKSVELCLTLLGNEMQKEDIEKGIREVSRIPEETRKNVGKMGRGVHLSQDVQRIVYEMCDMMCLPQDVRLLMGVVGNN